MKRLTSILAISVITVMTASAARADIASVSYVNDKADAITTAAEMKSNKVAHNVQVSEADQTSDEKYPSLGLMYSVMSGKMSDAVAKGGYADADENKVIVVKDGEASPAFVTADSIATSAVTTAKIGNLSVTNAKLAKEVTDSIADAKAAGTAATTALNQYKTTNDAAVKAAKDTADKAVVANAAITGATHTKITYDAKGLVTGGSNLGAADIPADLIKAGTNVTVARDTSTGVVTISSADTKYELPVATDTVRGGVIVDKALSADSMNPVQNKVVNTAIGTKITAPGTAEADITSDGTYTLTMKIVNGTKTYTWEKIGR